MICNESMVDEFDKLDQPASQAYGTPFLDARITLQVDGVQQSLTVDTRTTLLDVLRANLPCVERLASHDGPSHVTAVCDTFFFLALRSAVGHHREHRHIVCASDS
jgi:hypothetical protein